MARRSMDYPPMFGMDHPTWLNPGVFHYETAEDAAQAIRRVYGAKSGHIVVQLSRVESDTRESATNANEMEQL